MSSRTSLLTENTLAISSGTVESESEVVRILQRHRGSTPGLRLTLPQAQHCVDGAGANQPKGRKHFPSYGLHTWTPGGFHDRAVNQMRFLGAARSHNVTKIGKLNLAIIGHSAIVDGNFLVLGDG